MQYIVVSIVRWMCVVCKYEPNEKNILDEKKVGKQKK